ncbi:MAG: DoxX family protein [Vicinamibacterales bacterium]
MLTRLLATDASTIRLVQRIVLGLVILPHGLQKTIGLFGGYGFTGTMGFLTGTVGLPWAVAALVVLAESLGAAALVTGLLSRVTALGIAAVMVGAVVTSHLPNGFFMNWTGGQAGEGFEYHLLALALALPIVFAGGGAASVDGWLAAKLRDAADDEALPARAVRA